MNTEFYSLTISKVNSLTKEAISVEFDCPDDLKQTFFYKQGQHLTLRCMIDGKDVRRSYSICSNANKQNLEVAIKTIKDGVFSNYANKHFKQGMTIDVMAPQGHFYTDLDASHQKHYLCIAAGSGITPILSQIRTIFSIEKDSRITLLYVNKSTNLMMFRDSLSFVKNEFIDRFEWINLYTAEQHELPIFNGRLSANKLSELADAQMIELGAFNEAFLCGPEAMIQDIKGILEYHGLKQDNIHFELFFVDSTETSSQEHHEQLNEKYGDKMSRVTVKISGRTSQFDLEFSGENILDAALEQGADLPYSCKSGVCATCKAKLVKGEVEMDQNFSLTDDEVRRNMILTCQSHPISNEVEIDFDVN